VTPAELIAARHALHLSQIELARALGVAANTVNRWEAGTRAIPAYLWLALEGLRHHAATSST
jgi:DNA-binding transcriptional regulator YiaG